MPFIEFHPKPVGRRIELLKRITGNQDTDLKHIGSGSYQDTHSLGKDLVTKRIDTSTFSVLYYPLSDPDRQKKMKAKIDAHFRYFKNKFGDLVVPPKLFIGEATIDDPNQSFEAIFQVEADIRSLDIINMPEKDDTWLNELWELAEKNPSLMLDIKKLHTEWKKLSESGLDLDIGPNHNLIIFNDTETKATRLRIFDLIPVILRDPSRYTKTFIDSDREDLSNPRNFLLTGRKGLQHNRADTMYSFLDTKINQLPN